MITELPITGLAESLASGLFRAFVFSVAAVFGYVVGDIVGGIIKRLMAELHVDEKVRSFGLKGALIGFDVSEVVVLIVRIYLFLLLLALGAEIAGIGVLQEWAVSAMNYVSSAVQGVIILVIGLLIAGYLSSKIKEKESVLSRIFAFFIEIFIDYNALVIALPMLLPNADVSLLKNSFLVILFGLSFGVALALGLGIGLGLQGVLAKEFEKRRKELGSIL